MGTWREASGKIAKEGREFRRKSLYVLTPSPRKIVCFVIF